MSMDTPQLGLLFGATVAQHEAESARPWAPEVPSRHRGSARAARTHPGPGARSPGRCTTWPTRSPPPTTCEVGTRRDDVSAPPGPAPATYPVPHGAEQGGVVVSRVTLQTIADRVGVSRMTVSNAFSRPDQLSAEMRRTILAAAADLGYVGPDPSARALARGTTGAVGVLLTESVGTAFLDPIAAAFFGAVAEGLAPTGHGGRAPAVHRLRGHDPRARHPDGRRPGLRLRGRLPGGRLAGEAPAPAGVHRRRAASPARPACSSTSGTAPRLGAQHLLDLGHRRIGILTMNPRVPPGLGPGRRRRRVGLRRPRAPGGLGRRPSADAGVTPRRHARSTTTASRTSPRVRGRCSPGRRPPDGGAVLLRPDGRRGRARRRGRRAARARGPVGRRLRRLSAWPARLRPTLTTVQQDFDAKGKAAAARADVVDRRFRAGAAPAPEQHRILVDLVVRDSTAPPPST